MQLKHATEYKCILLKTDYRDSAEIQLNELFKDGWQFHSGFKFGLANGDTADYAVVYR